MNGLNLIRIQVKILQKLINLKLAQFSKQKKQDI